MHVAAAGPKQVNERACLLERYGRRTSAAPSGGTAKNFRRAHALMGCLIGAAGGCTVPEPLFTQIQFVTKLAQGRINNIWQLDRRSNSTPMRSKLDASQVSAR